MTSGYDTNLASEFYVLAVLHRLGMTATITLGNKKSVDIVVTKDAGDAITIDVKGLAGKSSGPVDNLRAGRVNHFIVFVSFLGKINDPSVIPEIYVVPSLEITKLIYQNPSGNPRVIPLHRARKEWRHFREKWDALK